MTSSSIYTKFVVQYLVYNMFSYNSEFVAIMYRQCNHNTFYSCNSKSHYSVHNCDIDIVLVRMYYIQNMQVNKIQHNGYQDILMCKKTQPFRLHYHQHQNNIQNYCQFYNNMYNTGSHFLQNPHIHTQFVQGPDQYIDSYFAHLCVCKRTGILRLLRNKSLNLSTENEDMWRPR